MANWKYAYFQFVFLWILKKIISERSILFSPSTNVLLKIIRLNYVILSSCWQKYNFWCIEILSVTWNVMTRLAFISKILLIRQILSWRHKKRKWPMKSQDSRQLTDVIGLCIFLWRHDKIRRKAFYHRNSISTLTISKTCSNPSNVVLVIVWSIIIGKGAWYWDR
jgi:hypothetical protein